MSDVKLVLTMGELTRPLEAAVDAAARVVLLCAKQHSNWGMEMQITRLKEELHLAQFELKELKAHKRRGRRRKHKVIVLHRDQQTVNPDGIRSVRGARDHIATVESRALKGPVALRNGDASLLALSRALGELEAALDAAQPALRLLGDVA